jgi:hypothetical protein
MNIPILSSRQKLIGIGTVTLLLISGGWWAGSAYTLSRTEKIITKHEADAQALGKLAALNAVEAEKWKAISTEQEVELSAKKQEASTASNKANVGEKKFRELLKTNASTEEKLAAAIGVIDDKNAYIERELAVSAGKDKIIDTVRKESIEWEKAYGNEHKRADELDKALQVAKSIRFRKWNVSPSYDVKTKDWGLSVDRNFMRFPVSGGLSVDSTTLDPGRKEIRYKIRVGINI